ncbi:MAG TPA: DUF5343 domain-containing protein [Pyrinomonadaceae bacterium]|nr:DUF5343 domain-containing protein [Pyrinomonadaceae bacterium]
MSQSISQGKELPYKPPYIAFKTLKNYLDTFKSSEDIPSHIERSVMPPKMSGGNQVAVINALKFLGLISDEGVPQEDFYKYIDAEPKVREQLLRDVLTQAYSFLLTGIDIERTTSRIVVERFREAGVSGDTIRKAIQFFQGAAKDVGMKVSPHMKVAQSQPARPKAQKARKGDTRTDEDALDDEGEDRGSEYVPVVEKTPYQVLIEILKPNMEEPEQDAVWTLIRYLKKQEAKKE